MTLDFALITTEGPVLQTNVPGKVERMAAAFPNAVPARHMGGEWQPVLSPELSAEARRRAEVTVRLFNVRSWERSRSPRARRS